jgi:hypothetical protein
MKLRMLGSLFVGVAAMMLLSPAFGQSGSVSSVALQGQNKGDTNSWPGGNLSGWEELDMIPCRVLFVGSGSNQVTLTFPHLTGTTPGFENFYNFTTSPNVTFISPPVLSAPAVGDWSYTFTVNVTTGGSVNFFARMAAGAHINVGSSLMIGGSPQSMGQLQVHKPKPGAGAPDLAVVKTGPATVPQGGTIVYTLTYTNKATGTNVGVGVQISDILPPGVTIDTNALPPGANYAGNTIFFDLPDLPPHAGGQITFPAGVPMAIPAGTVLTNFAQILSSQDEGDANLLDNTSTWQTKVTAGCTNLIVAPTSSQTACPGDTAIFSVTASGTALKYQWYYGNSQLTGLTNNTLSLANVSAANAGAYSVIVSDLCGDAVTNSATLTVNANTVATGPNDQTVCPGQTAQFSVSATGTALTYQWYYGNSQLTGQISNVLTLNGVTAANAGMYKVVVVGACTSVTNSANLTVNANTVATGPSDQTVCPGQTAQFSVSATGTGLTYQWYFGNSQLTGQASNVLTLNGVTAANAGMYKVVVMGACTSVTNSASLTVNANTAATGPSDQTVCPGQTAQFSVSATGTALTYQWYFGNSQLIGQTSNVLTLNGVTAANAGAYRVVVMGACSSVTNSANLTVNANTVATGPNDQTACPGQTAQFSVSATGTALTYQWYFGNSQLTGQTSNVLTLNGVTAANAGMYKVVVMGACTSVTNSASLTVNANTVATGPSDQTVCPGQTAQFSVSATGTALTYQWYFGNSQLIGQTSNVLTLNDVTGANAGAYRVVVMGACTSVTNSANLTVNANTVATGPTDQTVCPGQTAQFIVSATGTGLTYQWYYGNTQLTGQTSNVLTLNDVTGANAGAYKVVVMGACTSATNSANLTVNANTVTTGPTDQTVCPGQTAQFTVNATGTDLTYQWYYGISPLTGQTSNVLTLNGVTAVNAGNYSVVIMGACGTAVTNSSVLAVNQNVSVAPLANVTNVIGSSATFTAVASGTGPFTYQWYQGANPLAGQTNSTLTLNNLQPANGGPYSVSVAGQCGNAAAAGFILTIDLPPVVSIMYPTNGQVFVAPATFNVMASASDPDGTVTNVQFFSSTNGTDFVFLGETNNTPYLTIASNLPPGSYTFIATATDNLGSSAQSEPVTVQIVPAEAPTVTVLGNMTLNLQDGYQWLSNVVCNPINSHAEAVRVYVHNITNSAIKVVNASGTNNGLPYIESPAAIQPGSCWTNVIKFYDPLQLAFYPTLTVELVPVPNAAGSPAGSPVSMLPAKMLRNGTFLVEFASTNGAKYFVQYSSDLLKWDTSIPAITGTGQHMQWIDSGPPATSSLPAANVQRFYRVIQAQ